MKQGEAESHRSKTRPLNEHDTARKQQSFYYATVDRFRSFRSSIFGVKQRFYHTRYIWKFCYNATLCGCHLSNKTHNILKRLWCFHVFYKTKLKNRGRMTSLVADAVTRDESLFKIAISLDLNTLQNIWDNVSTQVSKIYNTVLVVFGYFNKKNSHLGSWTCMQSFNMLMCFDMNKKNKNCYVRTVPGSIWPNSKEPK